MESYKNYIDVEAWIIEDMLGSEYMSEDEIANEANNLIDDLNIHPESLEELLTHFEEMYGNFSESDNIARFALQNVINVRMQKILEDHCNG
jgi:hypothetical protein